MVDMLASVMPTQNLSRTLRLRVMRSVLGILPLLLLWAYFRFYSDDHGQAVLLADCDVFRPFSSFFSTVSKGCEGADNTCTAVKACAVSYRTVAFVANLVVGRIFAALSGPSTPFL